MSDEEQREPGSPPATSYIDRLHSLMRGTFGSAPIGGGLAAELFGMFVVSPYQRRLQGWFESVADRLKALEGKQEISLAELAENEVFVSTLMQATQAAVRTHREEKIFLLRHAVLAAAVGFPVSADLQSVFIRYVDELTPVHFVLLGFIHDNEDILRQFESYEKLLMEFVIKAGITLSGDEFRLLCSDLSVRLLVRFSSSMGDFTDAYRPSSILLRQRDENEPMLRVTDIGRELVRFVGASISPNSGPQADA